MSIAPDVYKKIVSAELYIDDNFNEPIDLDRLSRFHFHLENGTKDPAEVKSKNQEVPSIDVYNNKL